MSAANPYVGAYPLLEERRGVWREIARYVQQDAPDVRTLVELGAGYCDFANQFSAARKIAFDLNPEMAAFAAPDVELRIASAIDMPGIDDASVDLVFASNFLEHLGEAELARLLPNVRRVLAPGGRTILIQPNHRLCAEHYFDDPTHRTIFDDRNIGDWLSRHGLRVVRLEAGPASLLDEVPAAEVADPDAPVPALPATAVGRPDVRRGGEGLTMWCGKRVSLILPTYNERDSIRACIEEFRATGVVDEIVVVNNNAAPGTSEEVAKTCAREVHEPRQGYGAAIRRGFREVSGDFIIVSEPDGTFRGRDVRKMLAYAEDFEVVYGSRTVKELIWEGANMGAFLKWGNYAVAKLMELLFNTTSLTDVGCTVRCVRRDTLRRLEPHFTVDGSFFGPEMMVLSVLGKAKMIQVPVNYTARVGHSSVTGDKWVAFRLGLRMILLILDYRLRSWFFPARFAGLAPPRGAAALTHVDLVTEAVEQGEDKEEKERSG